MSFYRSILVAIAAFFAVGATSASADCCNWAPAAPVVYGQGGCGGCATAYAPIVYATPVVPAPIIVQGCGGCGTYAPAPVAYSGCCAAPAPVTYGGCGGCGVPAVYTTAAPMYVVNQGPD